MEFNVLFILSVIVLLVEDSLGFQEHELPVLTNCVAKPQTNPKIPLCKFSSSESPSKFKSECIKSGIGRISGDYSLLRISCSANYALDFFYEGTQPTEAINLTWSKSVVPNTRGQGLTFKIEVTVRSTLALHEYYKNTTSSKSFERMKIQDYTRTGKYIFRGIWNQSMEVTYCLFLEEGSVRPSLIRNKNTRFAIPSEEKNQITLPCLPSHYEASITPFSVDVSIKKLEKLSVIRGDVTSGITVPYERGPIPARFKCVFQYKNYSDELTFTVRKEWDKVPDFGFEELGLPVVGDVEINYDYGIDSQTHSVVVLPWCRMQDLNYPNTLLASVPAHNFAILRLIREFALPKFVNMSYTVRRGTERVELGRELKISPENALKTRFGITFCSSGEEHRVVEYGTSHTDGQVIKIPYGRDWTVQPRDSAPIKVFYLIKAEGLTPGSSIYANTLVTFSCRVHEAVIVKPIIWYTERKDGQVVEESIDYEWLGPISYFTKNVSLDTKKVMCAGSFWYARTWRNATLDLHLINGKPPRFRTVTTKYTFRPNLQNQILNCEVVGDPQPKLFWEFNGLDISSKAVRTETSIILDFPNISRQQAGEYICIAENRFGRFTKTFDVVVEDEPSVNYGVVVGVPTLIIILLTAAFSIYMRHWKQEQIGLTKSEIEDFINGQQKEKQMPTVDGSAYAHEFAHLVPYDKEFEIPASKYEIDESVILGAGAYGTVYKGTLKGLPIAIKTVNKNAEKSYLKSLLSELKIMIYLGSHPHIIQFLGANTSKLSKGSVHIFVKFCPLGSLEHYLKLNRGGYRNDGKTDRNYTKGFDITNLLLWAKQIAMGMEYLNRKKMFSYGSFGSLIQRHFLRKLTEGLFLPFKVIHGDLAARNVLLDENLQAQITDFGLSRQLYDYADYVKKNQEPLPWRWLAIESLRDLTFSSSSDVWSYGITMWEIFSLGEVPYPGFTWTMTFIKELENGLRMHKPKCATNFLYDEIMLNCWHSNPTQRPSFQQILEKLENGSKSEGYCNKFESNEYINVD